MVGFAVVSAADFKTDYDAALKLQESAKSSADLVKASQAFGKLTVRTDGGILLANAYFWQGECLYSAREYLTALACYEQTALLPLSYKEEASRFKAAMCRVKLGWGEAAKWELQRFIRDYPSSNLAGVARSELQKLGG